MTKLSYKHTAPNGKVTEVSNYPQVMALMESVGGRYEAIYSTIREPVYSFGFGILGVSKSSYRPNLV